MKCSLLGLNQLKKPVICLDDFVSLVTGSKDRSRFLARAMEVTYDVKFRCLFSQSLKTLFKAFKQLCCNLVVTVQILSFNLSNSTYLHSVYTDQPHLSGFNEFNIFKPFRLHSNAGVKVAEETFHRCFTVIVEDFGSKSALIEVHLPSIDMLVSVAVKSVNHKISSFTAAY